MHQLSTAFLVLVGLMGCRAAPSIPLDVATPDLPGLDLAPDLREGGCLNPPETSTDRPTWDAALDTVRDAPFDSDAPLDSDAPHDSGVDLPDLGSSPCAPCMVLVAGKVCVDRYEASRPDASATSEGTLSTVATCKAGVLPWYTYGLTRAVAQAACAAAGKRLCTPAEWGTACSGPQQTTYSYGNSYDPAVCNGIDTHCFCDAGQACGGVTPCPYPHCFNQPPPGQTTPTYCGAAFHVMPTGSFPACVDSWGVHDLNGNVWELVDTSDSVEHFRGGAYNCGDSELLHRCDYDATWSPSAQGFRCCADPLPRG